MKTLLFRLTIAAVAAVVLGMIAPASIKADPVHFVTGGQIAGGSPSTPVAGVAGIGGTAGSSTLVVSGVSLTFNGLVAANCPACPNSTPFSNIDLGNFTIVAPVGAPVPYGSVGFTLTVIQDTPGPTGTGTALATITGSVSFTAGGLFVTFASDTFSINGIVYQLRGLDPGFVLSLNNQATNGGVTNLSARITGSAVPEPASMLLLGTGLVGLAGAVRRRYHNRQ